MDNLSLTFALIGILGVGSQWLAIQLRLPAIVFMLAAGIVAGPVTGLINPAEDFGDLFKPIVAVAVAVILFEGGLTLSFKELRDAAPAVRRLCTVGAVLGWAFNTAAAHWVAGLDWATSAIFGGILVVTGPTVIIPLLRQARLSHRTASTLRWEAIVNDPIGALFAVLAFEVVVALQGNSLGAAFVHLTIGVVAATLSGWVAGRILTLGFRRGMVPEYMKAPALFAAVLAVYAATDSVLHESGLLAVTVMGVTMANAWLPSLAELKRFKEHVTILLVSGVFVILAATLDAEMLARVDWRAAAFVVIIMLVARPAAVLPSLAGTALEPRERLFVAWLAPRGVVAVAVSGFFGARLEQYGFEDGAMLAPLAFAIVAVTVVVHGFSIGLVARSLGLTSREPPGVIILGANWWTIELGRAFRAAEIPVLMIDRNQHRLGRAEAEGLATWYGEVLSEAAEHSLELNQYGTLIAATDNDDYNALVCSDVGHEFGRDRVYQIGRHERSEGAHDIPATLGGRTLLETKTDLDILLLRQARGWAFGATRLEGSIDAETWRDNQHEKTEIVALVRRGTLRIAGGKDDLSPRAGDTVVTFGPESDVSTSEA